MFNSSSLGRHATVFSVPVLSEAATAAATVRSSSSLSDATNDHTNGKITRPHQMHKMCTIAIDDPSVCHVGGICKNGYTN